MANLRWIAFRRWFWITILAFLFVVIVLLVATEALREVGWWRNFLASRLADFLIAVLVGLFGLSLYQQWQESVKIRQQRQEALTLLRDELSENNKKKEIENLCNRLRRYRGKTPIRFAFKTTVGEVVLDNGLLRGFDVSLQKGIHELNMRMREVNRLLGWVYEQSLDQMTKGRGFLVPDELMDWPAIEILPLVERVARQLDEMLDVVTTTLAEETADSPS